MENVCDPRSLRIVVYGAGAVGGAVGGRLALAGTKVVMIGRPGFVGAVRERGLRLITPTGKHTVKPDVVMRPEEIDFGKNDVVFLCVKSQDTEKGLDSLRESAGDVPVVCFQNGVRNEELVAKYFTRVYGATLRIHAVLEADAEVMLRRNPLGSILVGRYPSGVDALAGTLAAILRDCGFLVRTVSDVMAYKWGKLVSNLSNAVGAITNSSGPDAVRLGRIAQEEAMALLHLAGVNWVSDETLAGQWPESALEPKQVLPSEALGSTWQSLARQTGGVETWWLNGEIVRLAEALGKQAPVNKSLLRTCEEMAVNRERPGKYSPRQLLDMLE